MYDPRFPLLGIDLEENKMEKDTCNPKFISALFATTRKWKETMKLWAMLCSANDPSLTGHFGEFWQTVAHWWREWQSTSVFFLWEPHEQYEKEKSYDTERWTPQVPNMLLENSGEITPERMKRWSQSKNNKYLWMWLLMKVKSDAVKNNIDRNLAC